MRLAQVAILSLYTSCFARPHCMSDSGRYPGAVLTQMGRIPAFDISSVLFIAFGHHPG